MDGSTPISAPHPAPSRNTAASALQDLDACEVEFRRHCRTNFIAGGSVYGEDSAAIERIARLIAKTAHLIAAELNDSHTLALDFPPEELGERIAEAIDLGGEAGRLLTAHLRYLDRAS